MKLSFSTIFCLLLLASCYQPVSNNLSRSNRVGASDLPPNPKPGACYAKSLMPNIIDKKPMEIPVYIGDKDDTSVKRELKKYVLTEKSTAWVKKKAERNCLSPNPDDCLVWCLVEIPEEKIERTIVLDTSDSTSFKMETIYFNELQKKGGYTKWFEVLCANKVDETIISDLQNRLHVEQFLNEIPETPEFNSLTKAALKEYQREFGLPIGNLDFQTLAHLGIDY